MLEYSAPLIKAALTASLDLYSFVIHLQALSLAFSKFELRNIVPAELPAALPSEPLLQYYGRDKGMLNSQSFNWANIATKNGWKPRDSL
jgi:hypothetical protein